jgi:hypothetical protein
MAGADLLERIDAILAALAELRAAVAASMPVLLAGANWGVTRSTVRVSERRGISIVKIVIITTAAFLAMLSVAAAADLPW